MNNKAEFKIQGMMISIILAFGLFIGVIGTSITLMGNNPVYDTTGYNGSELNQFNRLDNISTIVENNRAGIENSNVDKDGFDFFAQIWDKLTAPFKAIYGSFDTLVDVSVLLVNKLDLFTIFSTFFTTLIVILVIIGIVLIKFKLGRNK